MSIQQTTLPNGIRVISDAMPHLETLSVGVWVDVGARYEPLELNGISHLLEHMAFKGTTRRSARQIAEAIEDVGGYLNAYTSREHTTYYARVMKEDTALAVDILGDILTNSLFDERELGKEKDVILQEIGQSFDTPDDIVFDKLQETAFPDQPVGRSILGTSERVAAFTADDIRGFMSRYYTGDALVVAAAGNVDHSSLVDMIGAALGDLPTKRSADFQTANYQGGVCNISRDLEQLHLTLGLESLAYDDPDYYALQVYSTVLGGGMSSRLFQEIRENRGLAYSVYSFVSSHTDLGLFGIYAGTHPEMAGKMVPLVADEMRRMCDDVSEAEITRASAQLKAGLLMSLESTSARIEQLGRQMLIFGRPIPVPELIERVDAIDVDAVRRVAERTLKGRPTMASVGHKHGFSEQEKLEQLFGSNAA